jgi:uncharacterized protein (DUF983 family)
MSDREDPSPEDLERFSGVTRACPACGEEVYDDAEVCYHCGEAMGSSSQRPLPTWAIIAAILAIVGFAAAILGGRHLW